MITNGWSLTLVCYDPLGEIDDPEELFRAFREDRYPWNIRCTLVTPCERVGEEGLQNSGLLDN